MIHLDHSAGGAQRWIFDQLLHRQDRPTGDVVLVQNIHGLELGLGHGPLLDAGEDFVEARQPGGRLGVVGVGLPAGLADHVANFLPDRRLGDEINVGIGIGLPALALQDAARLTAAGIVAGARHRVAERNPFAVLAVFLERAMGEALLIAQLDAGEVQDAVLHRGGDLLAFARRRALVQRGNDAERQMQAVAAVPDLRASAQRQPVAKAGGRSRTAGALRDVLIHLAVFVGAGAETLDRRHDHFRIDAVDFLPRKSHAIEHAGPEIFHQHVATLDQCCQDFLALRILGVQRDRALVVRSTLITSAPNHASNCVQVGPDWTWVKSRMRTPCSAFVMYFSPYDNSVACAGKLTYFLRSTLCGLRLPIRPLSEPAAGSITALIRVGLPESMASLTARLSSSGEVALTPVPPNASIILS